MNRGKEDVLGPIGTDGRYLPKDEQRALGCRGMNEGLIMSRYLGEIAWETEAWVAAAPSHLIHFNGERFLGPYSLGKRSPLSPLCRRYAASSGAAILPADRFRPSKLP